MTEERAAAALRVLETDLPPSTVDIDRAVRVGRRRERTRRALAAGALAGVAVIAAAGAVTVTGRGDAPPTRDDSVAASTTAAPDTCVPTALPGQAGEIGAMSPNGRYVVGTTGDPAVALLWTDGGPATVVPVPAGVAASPHAVNDDGVIVGLARRDDRTVAFVVRGGAYSELPLPSGAEGAAHGVNARGDAVGTAFMANGDTKALLWRVTGGMTALPSDAKWAAASAIGDDGTVFGTLGDGTTPYAWGPNGTGGAMPAIAGSAQGKAMGVAGDYVYGHAGTPQPAGSTTKENKERNGGEPRWVRWRLSTDAVVEVPGLSATDVDATGAVVGSVRGDGKSMPARWRGERIAVLRGLDGRPGTGSVVATSDDGTRLAGYTGDGHATVPVVWRCS
jgi:hypothetical protein